MATETKTKTITAGYYSSETTGTVKVEVMGTFYPWGPIMPETRGKLLVRRFRIQSEYLGCVSYTVYDALFLADPADVKDISEMEVPE